MRSAAIVGDHRRPEGQRDEPGEQQGNASNDERQQASSRPAAAMR